MDGAAGLDLATIVLTRGEALPRIDHDDFVRLLASFFGAVDESGPRKMMGAARMDSS